MPHRANDQPEILPDPLSIEHEWQRRSFRVFVESAWPTLAPGVRFTPGFHIDLMCQALEAVARGETRRLLITVPFRHGKTVLCSVLFPAWMWLTRPETRFLTASYSISRASADSLEMRRMVESSWYQQRWPQRAQLVDDQATKTRFETRQGGARVAVSVGAGATGEGGDILIVDDPTEIEPGISGMNLQATIDWFSGTFATRLDDPRTGAIIAVAQRLNEHDLPGHLIAQGGWTHLCLPMEYDPDHPHRNPADRRTARGELLWPERFPRAEVEALKRGLGSARAAAMLQQLPAPPGAMINRSWWRYYLPGRFPDRFDAVMQSWDVAFTGTTTSDYVVGQVWGIRGLDRYLLHQIRRQVGFNQTLAAIREQTAWVDTHFPGHHAHPILVERAANGAAIIETLRAEIPSIRPIIPDGDKVSRVYAIAGQIENGYVHVPGVPNHDGTGYDSNHTPEWVAAFIEEAAAFPHGRHDDQVDAMTQALRNAPSHAYRTSVSGPATMPRLARLPASVAAMMQTRRSVLDYHAFRASLEHR